MDVTAIRPTTTATIPTTTAAVGAGLSIVPPTKSPEAESETPPRIQPSKPISFSNGVLKRHAPPQVAYKECLKNHAATLGGHALDGCGEFMPSPAATPSDPTSLKCAACGCHRNFHRRDIDDSQPTGNAAVTHVIEYHPHHRHHPLPPPGSQHATPVGASARGVRSPGSQSQSPPPISSTYYPGSAPHMLLALSGGGVGGGNGVSDNNHTAPIPTNAPHHQHPQVHHHHHQQAPHMMMVNSSSSHPPSRKRFRTKFSQEQKDKMYEFAEKVGWKMQKTNEDMVNGFCNEIGVERGVFKVWMHNNKNTFGKRSATVSGSANNGDVNPTDNSLNHLPIDDAEHEHGDLNENGNNSNSSISINDHSHHHIHHHHHHQQYNGKSNECNAPTNGSSSSS